MIIMQSDCNCSNVRSYLLAVCILIGGRSERMGQPKESVIIPGDGRTFLDRICDEIDKAYQKIISQRYISQREDQQIIRDGYVPVYDKYTGIGPIGGIASVLERAGKDGYDATLFLACDMTGYHYDEISQICTRYHGEDVLFARTDGRRVQPLASIWSVKCLPAVLSMIEKGDHRLRDITEFVDNIRYYDTLCPDAYANINSMSDV